MSKADIAAHAWVPPYQVYGVFGLEAMTMGLPLLSAIHPDYYPQDCPVMNLSETEALDHLELLKEPKERKWRGLDSKRYVMQHHNPRKVARQWLRTVEA